MIGKAPPLVSCVPICPADFNWLLESGRFHPVRHFILALGQRDDCR